MSPAALAALVTYQRYPRVVIDPGNQWLIAGRREIQELGLLDKELTLTQRGRDHHTALLGMTLPDRRKDDR